MSIRTRLNDKKIIVQKFQQAIRKISNWKDNLSKKRI